MRIVDTYLPTIVGTQTEKSSKSTAAGDSSSPTALTQSHLSGYDDSAEVSGLSKLLNQAMNANTDSDSLEVLRAQYQSGDYQVDAAALGKILAREFMDSGW